MQITQKERQLSNRNNDLRIVVKLINNSIIEHQVKNSGRLYVRKSNGVIKMQARSCKENNSP